MDDFIVDTYRYARFGNATGIFVRSVRDGITGSHDIASLDRDSLRAYTSTLSRPALMGLVAMLLGHPDSF